MMAKLVAFLISENTQNVPKLGTNDTVPQITSPVIALRPQVIPTNFSFAITFGVADIDMSQKNTLRLVLKRPSGAILQDFGTAELCEMQSTDTLPLEYSGFIGSVDFRNTLIDEEGCYRIELYINGELIGERYIPIFKGVGAPK